jgi:hypothetical protein
LKIRLERTDDYKLQRANLSRSARLALRFVEQAIKGSPDEPRGFSVQQYRIPEAGNIVVTIVENGGLLVGYHRTGPGAVSMDMVLDRRSGADWYARE